MSHAQRPGVLDLEYAGKRRQKRAHRYRLARRTQEVARALRRYGCGSTRAVLDLGAADGRMLDSLAQAFPIRCCAGVEYDGGLARLARSSFPHLFIVRADAQSLPLADDSFDAVVAAALIEHLSDPSMLLQEARRVLRPGGLLVLTCPDPFWERLATRLGHLDDDQHQRVPNLSDLRSWAADAGLAVVEAEKFMLSPIGMWGELAAERIVRALHLRFLLANQILVARKPMEPPGEP